MAAKPIKIQLAIFGIVANNSVPLRPILSIKRNGTIEPRPTPTYIKFTIQTTLSLDTFTGSSCSNFGIIGVLHPSFNPLSMIRRLPMRRWIIWKYSAASFFNRFSYSGQWFTMLVWFLIKYYLQTIPINICRNIPRSMVVIEPSDFIVGRFESWRTRELLELCSLFHWFAR